MPAMPLIPAPVGLGLLFVTVIAGRILQERALRRLSTTDKGRLVEAFAGLRMVALLPLAAIAGLYFLMSNLDAMTVDLLLALYLPAMLVFAAVMQWTVRRRLQALDFDPEFQRAHGLGRALTLIGFGLFLLSV
jgi:hypothetical protein